MRELISLGLYFAFPFLFFFVITNVGNIFIYLFSSLNCLFTYFISFFLSYFLNNFYFCFRVLVNRFLLFLSEKGHLYCKTRFRIELRICCFIYVPLFIFLSHKKTTCFYIFFLFVHFSILLAFILFVSFLA